MADTSGDLARVYDQLALDPSLRLVAGGTDLMVADLVARCRLGPLLDVSRIEELREIRVSEQLVRLGAGVTFTEIRRHPELPTLLPSLAAAAAEVGGWQIQNRATLGGNVANASPAGDSLPVLLALDAVVVCGSRDGERRVPYRDFHRGYRETALRPGELIVRFEIPRPEPGSIQRFRKVGTRRAQAISKVVLALWAQMDEGRIVAARLAAGSVAPMPVRLEEAEKTAVGGHPEEVAAAVAAAARAEVQPIADVRSTAEYRSAVLENIVGRWVRELAEASEGEP